MDGDQKGRRSRAAMPRWLIGARPEILPLPSDHSLDGGAPTEDQFLEEPVPGKAGICCSGGGIRSAAYNLGALQALRESGVLGDARYVAAVSGGSYIAAAHTIVASESPREALTDEPPYAPGSPEERHLRNRSNYLYPNLVGLVTMVFNLLYGLIVNALVVGATLFAIGIPLGWMYAAWLHPEMRNVGGSLEPGKLQIDWGEWRWVLALLALGVTLVVLERLADALWAIPKKVHDFVSAWSFRFAGAGILAFLVLVAIPWAISFATETIGDLRALLEDIPSFMTLGLDDANDKATFVVTTLSSLGVIFGAARLVLKRAARFSLLFAQLFGWMLILTPLLIFVRNSSRTGYTSGGLWWVVGSIALLLVLSVFSTNMRWSMQPFYRRRLSSAFFVRRQTKDRAGPVEWKSKLLLSKLEPDQKHPLPSLIICAALNVTDAGVTPPRRNADGFTFTKERSGGPLTTYVPTGDIEQEAGERVLTLPGMVTVTGAALSPSMGKMTVRQATMVLALVNARLGMWLPNPLYKDGWAPEGWFGRLIRSWRSPGPLYFWYEILGSNSLRRRHVYVSDGGHYENLGLVELLRRGCTEIYCFDAAGDDINTFNTIGQAISIAASDLQVKIDINPEPDLKPDPTTGRSPDVCALGSITYPDGTEGTLHFVKAAISDGCPWNVLAYRAKDPTFPTHPTSQQIFTDEKFEAYRSLGYYSANRLFERIGPSVVSTSAPTTRAGAVSPVTVAD